MIKIGKNNAKDLRVGDHVLCINTNTYSGTRATLFVVSKRKTYYYSKHPVQRWKRKEKWHGAVFYTLPKATRIDLRTREGGIAYLTLNYLFKYPDEGCTFKLTKREALELTLLESMGVSIDGTVLKHYLYDLTLLPDWARKDLNI